MTRRIPSWRTIGLAAAAYVVLMVALFYGTALPVGWRIGVAVAGFLICCFGWVAWGRYLDRNSPPPDPGKRT